MTLFEIYLAIAVFAGFIELSQDTGGFALEPANTIVGLIFKGLIWPFTLVNYIRNYM